MRVCFDSRGVVAGAAMSTYLLEKSRVIFQGPQERNYHAAYMLLAGADADERQVWPKTFQLPLACHIDSTENTSRWLFLLLFSNDLHCRLSLPH